MIVVPEIAQRILYCITEYWDSTGVHGTKYSNYQVIPVM